MSDPSECFMCPYCEKRLMRPRERHEGMCDDCSDAGMFAMVRDEEDMDADVSASPSHLSDDLPDWSYEKEVRW